MTTRYEYKCNKCGNDYIEQRKDSELDLFFSNCSLCGGLYEEVNKVFIELDIQPETQPEIIIDQPIQE